MRPFGIRTRAVNALAPLKTNKSAFCLPWRRCSSEVTSPHAIAGDCWRDVSQSAQLRYADPDMMHNNAANAEVLEYREAYAAPDRLLVFLPAIMSTSDRIHGEFLCLLHILSHRQAVKFFDAFGEEPTDDAFTFRRAAYFFHNRVTIGLTCAQVTTIIRTQKGSQSDLVGQTYLHLSPRPWFETRLR